MKLPRDPNRRDTTEDQRHERRQRRQRHAASGKGLTGPVAEELFAAGVDVGNWNNVTYFGNNSLGAGTGYVAGDAAAKQPIPKGGFVVAAD